MVRRLGLLWCWLRGHKIKRGCGCHPIKSCSTCILRKLDAAYEPDAYKVGDHLWVVDYRDDDKEVIVERISRPTTFGSKAWLMTRTLKGGGYGAPDTYFSKTPVSANASN